MFLPMEHQLELRISIIGLRGALRLLSVKVTIYQGRIEVCDGYKGDIPFCVFPMEEVLGMRVEEVY